MPARQYISQITECGRAGKACSPLAVQAGLRRRGIDGPDDAGNDETFLVLGDLIRRYARHCGLLSVRRRVTAAGTMTVLPQWHHAKSAAGRAPPAAAGKR